MQKSIKINVISIEEFRKQLMAYILHDWDRADKQDVLDLILINGFPKFEKDNLAKFLENLQKTILLWFPPTAIDFGDGQFLWLVSGSNAILIEKEPKPPIKTNI